MLDGTSLKEFAFEEGWKDTCYNSGSDYVSLYYVDATKAAAEE